MRGIAGALLFLWGLDLLSVFHHRLLRMHLGTFLPQALHKLPTTAPAR